MDVKYLHLKSQIKDSTYRQYCFRIKTLLAQLALDLSPEARALYQGELDRLELTLQAANRPIPTQGRLPGKVYVDVAERKRTNVEEISDSTYYTLCDSYLCAEFKHEADNVTWWGAKIKKAGRQLPFEAYKQAKGEERENLAQLILTNGLQLPEEGVA